jgi:ATP-dependent Clp protease ATP-binding subunit ClpC
VLLDEIEKAHNDVFNMLLQIMEEGVLTDSFGRRVDFRNTILIMTSNLGSSTIKNQASLGFQVSSEKQTYESMKKQLMEEIEKEFRPEFLNRLDDVIVFHSLTRENLIDIVDIEVRQVQERLRDRGLELNLTQEAKEFLIGPDYNMDFGARPLRRAIEQFVEDPLSEEILKGAFKDKNTVDVKVKDGHLYFDFYKKEETEVEEPEPVPAS